MAPYKTKDVAWFVCFGFSNEENVGVGREEMFLSSERALHNAAR